MSQGDQSTNKTVEIIGNNISIFRVVCWVNNFEFARKGKKMRKIERF
ncbi:MAG: hypothetical protein ACXAEU_11540 [Candidatus Hodarchaeales archaeon]